MKTKLAVLVASISMAVAFPAAATAASPASDAYLSTPISVPPTVQGASDTTDVSAPQVASVTAPQSTGDTLPFTGLDVGIVAAAALLLLGLGLALRRGTSTTI